MDGWGGRDTWHNFQTDRRLMMFLGGHYIFERPRQLRLLSFLYVGFLFLLILYLQSMTLVAIRVSLGDVVMTIHTFHTLLLLTVMLAGVTARMANYRKLDESARIIMAGVYSYEGEFPDDEHLEIKRDGVEEIRRLSMAFTRFLCFSGTSNTVFVSLMQLLIIKEDTSSWPLNPYLPQPIYMPFNTRSTEGFTAGFLLLIVYMVYLCLLVICMDEIYLSCTVQLRDQYRILNHSLLTVEQRARRILRPGQDLQAVLYGCLKRNVQHHHALIRMKKTFESYTGGSFLIVFSLASLILAAHVVLILENPGIHIMANFIVTLTAELFYTLHYCWYGEQIISTMYQIMNVVRRSNSK